MIIFVTRHGKAERDSESGRDEDRALRKRGERQARWLGEELARTGIPPELILASPLRRAQETAAIIAGVVGVGVETEPVLGLGHAASDVLETLEVRLRADAPERLMIVGHNPQLESLTGNLTGGATGRPVDLRTGECAVVDVAEPARLLAGGRLRQLLRLVDK